MSSQDIMLLIYPVISSHEDLVSDSFKHVYNLFLIKTDDVRVYNLIKRIRELNSPKEESILTILCQKGVMV